MSFTSNFYAVLGNRFGIHAPGYGPQGHRGQDFKVAAGVAVPAYEGGTVTLIQHSTFIGEVVVIHMSDGKYAGYCHLRTDVQVKIGQKVAQGHVLGYVAGAHDNPGTSWTGPHLHTTLSANPTGVFMGVVLDPLPRIHAALAAPVALTHYTVRSGDTLTRLAILFYKDASQWSKIYSANRNVIGHNPDVLRVGETLIIPTPSAVRPTVHAAIPTVHYTVKSGDTLSQLAAHYYRDSGQWSKIYNANRAVIGGNPDVLNVGATLVIPK